MSQDALLQHTATVQRLSTSKDAAGGTVNSYTTRQSGVRCMIRPASSSEILLFANQQIQVSHVIVTLYTGTEIGDRLLKSDGRVYDVQGIALAEPMGNISTFVTLQAKELL